MADNKTPDYTTEQYWSSLANQSLIRFFILKALKDKDLHGYLLIEEVSQLSGEFCKPSESTLYPALNQMLKAGLIQKTASEVKTRKTYRITAEGKIAFKAGAKVWNEVIPKIQRSAIL